MGLRALKPWHSACMHVCMYADTAYHKVHTHIFSWFAWNWLAIIDSLCRSSWLWTGSIQKLTEDSSLLSETNFCCCMLSLLVIGIWWFPFLCSALLNFEILELPNKYDYQTIYQIFKIRFRVGFFRFMKLLHSI